MASRHDFLQLCVVGERMKNGFTKSMGEAIRNEALAQGNPVHEEGARNQALWEQAAESRETGTDHSKQRIERFLDI